MKKSSSKAEVSPLAELMRQVAATPQDDAAKKAWPTMWACLTPVWRAGKCTRQSGKMSIRLSGSWFILTISCPTEGLQASVGSESLSSLFDALEAKLRDPACQWEPDWESTKKTRQVRVDPVDSK
jgi:hypothetical protein